VYLCLAAALAGLNRRGDAIRALEDALQLQWGSEEEAAVGAENDDGTVPAPFNIDVKNVFEGQLENRENGFKTRRQSSFRPFSLEFSRF
jgi:hypothetical protein